MSEQPRSLILASTSPRRRELLRKAGFDFSVVVPGVDESPIPGELPAQLAERLARAKADAGSRGQHRNACVLAADTVVLLGDRVLGKPEDPEHAAEMLSLLSGHTHQVITGVAIGVLDEDRTESLVETSRVRMRDLGVEEIQRYAHSGEPLDKAGGYALQGRAGDFVEEVIGSRSNVIGLPIEVLLPILQRLRVVPG